MKTYKKIGLLLVLFSFCFLISCRVTRQEVKKTESQSEVASEKVTIYQDTIVFAPKSATSLRIPISDVVFKSNLNPISKLRVFTQKNGNATAKMKIEHDTVFITATCDSLAIIAKIKKQYEKETNKISTADNTNLKQTTGYSFWHLIMAFILGFGVCFILKIFKIIR